MTDDEDKKTPSQLRREPDRKYRRNEMIKAAESLILTQGFEKTMMAQVAFGAGCSKATVYKYFPSKEDLYLAVAAIAFRRLCDTLDQALKTAKKGNKVQDMNNAYLKFVRSRPSYAEIFNDIRLRFSLAKIIELENSKQELTESEKDFRRHQQNSFDLFLTCIKSIMNNESTLTLALAIRAFIPGFIKELVLRERMKTQSTKESEKQLRLVFDLIQSGINSMN
jgi:AcrR family transcriptional regulator